MSTVKAFCIPLICTSFIFPYSSTFSLKILPKHSLFHFLIFDLRILSFCWTWYIFVPLMVGISSHHSFSFPGKSAWRSQKILKLKGLHRLIPTFSHSSLIGQWYDPTDGSIVSLNSSSFIMMVFETKKWSS